MKMHKIYMYVKLFLLCAEFIAQLQQEYNFDWYSISSLQLKENKF